MAAQVRLMAPLMLLVLAGCGMPGQTEDPNQDFWGSFYGTGKSDDQKDADWWGGFYGTKKPKEDPACGFYGNCGGAKSGAGG